MNAIEGRMPNDAKDRHVLAAAVVAEVAVVVTSNVRHFAPADLSSLGKRGITPDGLLCELLRTRPTIVRGALQRQAAHMHTPRTWTEGELLGLLEGLGHGDAQAPKFAQLATQAFGIAATSPPTAF